MQKLKKKIKSKCKTFKKYSLCIYPKVKDHSIQNEWAQNIGDKTNFWNDSFMDDPWYEAPASLVGVCDRQTCLKVGTNGFNKLCVRYLMISCSL